MDMETIKAALAPCGLNCEKCFAHVNGDIRKYAEKLKEALGNFSPYAQRFETLLDEPVFKKYPAFKEMLAYLASENCQGCRNEQCKLFKDCGVRVCHQEKQTDFCHQCDEFPCGRTNFNPGLYENWVLTNQKIRKNGLETFYGKSQRYPRYP